MDKRTTETRRHRVTKENMYLHPLWLSLFPKGHSGRSTVRTYETRRIRKIKSALLSLCLCTSCVLILAGCNRGLAPTQASTSVVQPGFGGTVRFISAWPPSDSVQDLRVVAFYNYPPTNIFTEVTGGQAEVYPAIGATGLSKFVDSLSYKFTLDSAATFRYVVVAMQYGSNILQDWKVVGAYGYSHGVGQPDSVVVPAGSFVNGIDIDVDFKNTPPTPFSGVSSASERN